MKSFRLGPGGLDPVEVFETLPEVRFFFKFKTSIVLYSFPLQIARIRTTLSFSSNFHKIFMISGTSTMLRESKHRIIAGIN